MGRIKLTDLLGKLIYGISAARPKEVINVCKDFVYNEE